MKIIYNSTILKKEGVLMKSFLVMLGIVVFTAVFTLSPTEEKTKESTTEREIQSQDHTDSEALVVVNEEESQEKLDENPDDISEENLEEVLENGHQEEDSEESAVESADEKAEENGNEPLPEITGVPHSFFNDSMIVGDSITNQLSAYTARVRNTDPDYFGTVRFGGVGNYGINNALSAVSSSSTHHVYQGVTMNTPDYIATRHKESPIDIVYIMMGMNDLNIYREIDKTVTAYGQLLQSIRDKVPDVNIVVLGLTPVGEVFTAKSSRHNPEYMTEFNTALAIYCQENGYGYINTYPYFADETGLLPDDLASADGFHLTDKGYSLFVEMLCQEAGNVTFSPQFQEIPEEESSFQEEIPEEPVLEAEPTALDIFFQSLTNQDEYQVPTDFQDIHPLFLQEQYAVQSQDMLQLVAKQTASYGVGIVDTLIFAQANSEEEAIRISKIWKSTVDGFLNQNKLYDIVAYDIYAKSEIIQQGDYLALIITDQASEVKNAFLTYLEG